MRGLLTISHEQRSIGGLLTSRTRVESRDASRPDVESSPQTPLSKARITSLESVADDTLPDNLGLNALRLGKGARVGGISSGA